MIHEKFLIIRILGNDIPSDAFSNSDSERIVRLVVRDNEGLLRDSHVGMPELSRVDTTVDGFDIDSISFANYTSVPIDFSEWYFIVASFNPYNAGAGINEDTSFGQTFETCYNSTCDQDEDFWRNNIDSSGYISQSTEGAMCKVEVISKSDLTRARGYGV